MTLAVGGSSSGRVSIRRAVSSAGESTSEELAREEERSIETVGTEARRAGRRNRLAMERSDRRRARRHGQAQPGERGTERTNRGGGQVDRRERHAIENEAAEECADRVKAEVPIWKEQSHGDGSTNWVGLE